MRTKPFGKTGQVGHVPKSEQDKIGPLAANIQQLQYVALTRAKRAATVIRYGGGPD
jgi:hypothetical protein